MPFTHLVSFRWKSEPPVAEVDRITSELTALAARLDGVRSYQCGPDVSGTPNSYDYAVIGVFDTRADFEAYRDHPEHLRIRDELMAPLVDSRVLVQLQR